MSLVVLTVARLNMLLIMKCGSDENSTLTCVIGFPLSICTEIPKLETTFSVCRSFI